MSADKVRELLIRARDHFLFTDDDGSVGVSDRIDIGLFSDICVLINDGFPERPEPTDEAIARWLIERNLDRWIPISDARDFLSHFNTSVKP